MEDDYYSIPGLNQPWDQFYLLPLGLKFCRKFVVWVYIEQRSFVARCHRLAVITESLLTLSWHALSTPEYTISMVTDWDLDIIVLSS